MQTLFTCDTFCYGPSIAYGQFFFNGNDTCGWMICGWMICGRVMRSWVIYGRVTCDVNMFIVDNMDKLSILIP